VAIIVSQKSRTCHITSSLLQYVLKISASSTYTCSKRIDVEATRNQHIQ